MKKTLSILMLVALASLGTLLTSCGGESTPDPEDTTTETKTVTKSHIFDKDWYGKGDTRSADFFGSDGSYGASGTWSWEDEENNIMRINQNVGPDLFFHFKYTTTSEIGFTLGDDELIVYRDAIW